MQYARSGRLILWPAIVLTTLASATHLGLNLQNGAIIALCLSLASTFGFVLNDLHDIETDRVNGARRLQSTQKSERKQLRILNKAVAFFSLLLSTAVDARLFFGMVCILLALVAYTFWARKILWVANILCCLVSASPLWLPILVSAQHSSFIILWTATAFAILFAREIAFDARDLAGDAASHRKTVATKYGRKAALKTAASCYMMALALPAIHLLSHAGAEYPLIYSLATLSLMALSLIAVRELVSISRARKAGFAIFVSTTRAVMILTALAVFVY